MIKHSANDMVSEQVDRLVAKCAQEKNIVSEAALYELKLAVEASPEDFISDEEERAFAQYVNVIGKYQAGITKEIDSDADFFASRMDLLNFLHNQMTNIIENPALANTSINLEAQRILAQISNNHPAAILNDLLDLQKEFDPIFKPKVEQAKQAHGDAWTCAEARPLLRLYAQIAPALSSLKKPVKTSCFSRQQICWVHVLPWHMFLLAWKMRKGSTSLTRVAGISQMPGCVWRLRCCSSS